MEVNLWVVAYIVDVVPVDLFEATGRERHSEYSASDVGDVQVVLGVLKPPSVATHDSAQPVHYY